MNKSILASVLSLLFFIPCLHAGDQDFTLVNDTGFTVDQVYITPADSDDWGDDILGRDTLADGESVDIKFHRKEKAKHWDLKVVDTHGDAVKWEDINLLEVAKITIHYKNDKAWATFD